MKKLILTITILFLAFALFAQDSDSLAIRKFFNSALSKGEAYNTLNYMCTHIGQRLAGSENAEKAVTYTEGKLKEFGADSLWLQDCMVTHWVRGDKETASAVSEKPKRKLTIPCTALGGSVGTGTQGLTATVVEVDSIGEVKRLGKDKITGKIVFYNGAFDPTILNTFTAYGRAVVQRTQGAMEAAKYGAVGVLVRSMTPNHDDLPHTGAMGYVDSIKKIPAIAISTNSADSLHAMLSKDANVQVTFRTTCETLPDVPSHNVIAEIKGTKYPKEIIVVGGHLDSWDLAQGAQDDGAGVVQSMEVLRIYKLLGIRPKHTIRVVLFMNEEHGGQGAAAYANFAKTNNETAVAAFETDCGGFAPRGFSLDVSPGMWNYMQRWKPLLTEFNCGEFIKDGSGADVGDLKGICPVLGELYTDPQRYFDIHHDAVDDMAHVNYRELELGAASLAGLMYLIDEEGVPMMTPDK
jgi:carboxypeptidase Q